MIEVKVDTSGLSKLLRDIQVRAGNLRPALTKIAGEMAASTEENFDQEGRPRWPNLSASTQKQRAAKGKTGKMLQVSGQLAASISQRVTEDSAIVGTNKIYAGIHQFGGMAGRKRQTPIPARPFLKLTKSDVDLAEKILARYLTK